MIAVSIIIFFCVIFLSMLNAKIFNFIHGFFTFFGIAALLTLIYMISVKANAHSFANGYYKIVSMVLVYIIDPLVYTLNHFRLTFMSDISEYPFYIVVLGLWIISFIISIAIRKGKNRI